MSVKVWRYPQLGHICRRIRRVLLFISTEKQSSVGVASGIPPAAHGSQPVVQQFPNQAASNIGGRGLPSGPAGAMGIAPFAPEIGRFWRARYGRDAAGNAFLLNDFDADDQNPAQMTSSRQRPQQGIEPDPASAPTQKPKKRSASGTKKPRARGRNQDVLEPNSSA